MLLSNRTADAARPAAVAAGTAPRRSPRFANRIPTAGPLAEAPATGWTLWPATLDQQDGERHPLVPPSRDVQLRQRSGAAAGVEPPSSAAEPEQPDRPGSRGGSAPSTARAPGRQPHLPFAAEPPESSGSGSLWRLAAGIIGVGAPPAAKRQEEPYQRRQAAKKRTTSEEVELTADGKGARIVPVVVELEGGGFVPEHPAAAGGQRRVAFETTVELDTGGTVPLRTGGEWGKICGTLPAACCKRAVWAQWMRTACGRVASYTRHMQLHCVPHLAAHFCLLPYSSDAIASHLALNERLPPHCCPLQSRPTTAARLCGEWGAWTGAGAGSRPASALVWLHELHRGFRRSCCPTASG